LRLHNSEIDRRVIPAAVSQSEFVADFEQLLNRPRSVAFVAESGGTLAGFIAGNIERNLPDRLPEEHATVGYLWVEPAFRRHGIARALFEEVAAWARSQEGIGHFEMAVLSADTAAAGFWRSIGFSPFIERLWAPLSAPERDE
jgi:ribosomal protein S18 acetylase RimI-like enzyme